MEPPETFEEAAAREISEEVGIRVENLSLFGIYSGKERLIRYPNGDTVYSLSVIFLTRSYHGEISNDDSEVLEHRFFDRDHIPLQLFPPDARPILDWASGMTEVPVK